jgi:hypothetical protein
MAWLLVNSKTKATALCDLRSSLQAQLFSACLHGLKAKLDVFIEIHAQLACTVLDILTTDRASEGFILELFACSLQVHIEDASRRTQIKLFQAATLSARRYSSRAKEWRGEYLPKHHVR